MIVEGIAALSFSWMKDGKPANNSQERAYYAEGYKVPVHNKKTLIDVQGCLLSISTINSKRFYHG